MSEPDQPDDRNANDGDEIAPADRLQAILEIPVTVQVVLGSTSMPVAALMKLGRNAVITLDQRVGEPLNVVVNGKIVARGEMVVVDEDNSRFGVTLTEVVRAPAVRERGAGGA